MRRRVAPVDRVGVDERAAVLGKRSIKSESQQQAIRMAVSMVDLTTLEGQDTPGKVAQLAAKAVCPAPTHPEIPSVAAVCVYPSRVADAKRALDGSGVAVASVATGFPSGLTSMELKLEETREAVAAGATEIDMVIPRDAYLSGDDQQVVTEVEQVKEACGPAHLKVIVEVDELGGYDHIRHATLALDGGRRRLRQDLDRQDRQGRHAERHAGDARGGARLRAPHREDRRLQGRRRRAHQQAGDPPAVLVKETLGDDWLTPDRFRIGASSLLNDLLMQYEHGASGRYQRPEDFSKE